MTFSRKRLSCSGLRRSAWVTVSLPFLDVASASQTKWRKSDSRAGNTVLLRVSARSSNRNRRAFARALWRIARRYRGARRIHVALDNLSTHSQSGVVQAFGARAGGALWRRFVVHYTPKHASWLNAADMETSLVSRECIGTRRNRPPALAQVRSRCLAPPRRTRRMPHPVEVHRLRREARLSIRRNHNPSRSTSWH
jgi:hypothetical protein